MNETATFIGVSHALVGLLLIALAIPLILRRIGMNSWYGVRVQKAFQSEANWYAINHMGGRWLAAAGVVVFLVGVFVVLRPPTSDAMVVLLSLAPVLVVLLTLIPVLRYARRLPS